MTNVIDFPKSNDKKIQKAIDLFSKETADVGLLEFLRLIDEGCDEAFSFAGNIYEIGGRGVEQDYEKARFYYEQSVERVGSVAAYLGLIRIYFYGLGAERDCCKALEYCTILAEEKNHPHANLYIGRMYMEGCCVKRDLEKSKDFFKKAWESGYVFGLTYLGIAEQKTGHYLRGWLYRIRAGFSAYKIGLDHPRDARIHEP